MKTPFQPFFLAGLLLFPACTPQSSVPDSPERADETVWIEGGRYAMGEGGSGDAAPPLEQTVPGFWMQQYEVTNTRFEVFCRETGYRTQAEKTGGSYVFRADGKPDASSLPGAPWWRFTAGADWRHPQGKDSGLRGKEYHPVTHVSHADACAYCDWLGMRLPTEAEWEWAARSDGEKRQMNVWQGLFPQHNEASDGFTGTAPVGSFPAGKTGLYDINGNVWEYCADPYNAGWYTTGNLVEPAQRMAGPARGYDPSQPYGTSYVIRGGSYLCSENYCRGYLPYTRMRSDSSQTFAHIGFRCVRSGTKP